MCIKNTRNQSNRGKLAHLAIEASINLGKWDQVQAWLPSLDVNH